MKTTNIFRFLPVAAIALATVGTMSAQAAELSSPEANQVQMGFGESFTIAQGSASDINATDKYSYLGIGGNIGLSDADQGTAESGFAVISKGAITKNISLRPSVVVGDDTIINVPITYDFSINGDSAVANSFTPYIGAGATFDTGADDDVDFMLTTGLDYRFAKNWVGNASVNVGFEEDNSDVGVMLGVGYSFDH